MWAILTDGDGYREWNPEIVRIDGRITLGGRITAHVRLGDGAVRAVTQRVTALEAPTRMEWVGGLPLGLFAGRRSFSQDHTRLVHGSLRYSPKEGNYVAEVFYAIADR